MRVAAFIQAGSVSASRAAQAVVEGEHPSVARSRSDGTFELLQASDAEVVQEPTEQPYGIRDCAFRDPAGNQVRIQELS